MSDGVRLSARLWLPERRLPEQRIPVVLEYLPYRKRDAYRSTDDVWGSVLMAAGIAFARVDVRGTGDSEGVLTDEYSEWELADGEAIIDWLSRQDWCNGRVGMRGISWGGINTLQIAARRPPALKAIVPMAAADNRFTDDAHFIGGLLAKPNLDWGVLFKTVLAGPPDPAISGADWAALWRRRLTATPAVITDWLRHRSFDAFWQRGSVCLDYSAIQCPVYMVAGWQDAYVNFVERLLGALDVPVKALIGPWGHTYPHMARPQSVDWAAEEVRWWRQWLLEEDTGIMREPRLHLFMAEATARQCLPEPVPGRWLADDEWPAAGAEVHRFNLAPSELLAHPQSSATNAFLSFQAIEPVGSGKAEWLDRLPEEQSRDDDLSLCFTTPPLEQDLELMGRAQARLKLTPASSECAVSVRLMDVAPDGSAWLVCYGTLDLSFRQSFASRLEVVAGEALAIELPLSLAAHRFKAGHRLRLAVAGGLWPMTWPAKTDDAFSITVSESALELPVRPGTAATVEPSFEQKVKKAPAPERLPGVTRTAEGGYRYAVTQAPYTWEVPGIGTRLSGEGEFEAVRGPAAASRWQQSSRRSWRRDDWHCEVEASCSLERVESGLLVRESLRAYRDGELVFEKHHEAVLDE